MTLHVVSRSPYESQAFTTCLNLLHRDDALLLIDDGVFGLLQPSLSQLPCPVFYLLQDAQTRGVVAPGQIEGVDFEQMVTLTELHTPIQTWP